MVAGHVSEHTLLDSVALIVSFAYNNYMTSWNPKWLPAENLKAKIGDNKTHFSILTHQIFGKS